MQGAVEANPGVIQKCQEGDIHQQSKYRFSKLIFLLKQCLQGPADAANSLAEDTQGKLHMSQTSGTRSLLAHCYLLQHRQ